MDKIKQYILYFITFIIGQSFSMWGQYFTLKYPKLSMVQAFKIAIPFAWVDWFFVTIAVGIAKAQQLFTETQDIFILIITQFCLVLLINKFYLKQPISKSDFVCFVIILFAFFVSYNHLLSYATNTPIPEKILEASGQEKTTPPKDTETDDDKKDASVDKKD